jgi:hypothetical protein
MRRDDRQSLTLEDDDGRQLHATWSRSRKRLIVTVTSPQAQTQLELRPEQADNLVQFVSEGALNRRR